MSCTPQVSVAEGKALWPVKAVQHWGIPRASLAEQKRAGEVCKLLLQLLPVPEKSCDSVIAPEIFLDFFFCSLLNPYSIS